MSTTTTGAVQALHRAAERLRLRADGAKAVFGGNFSIERDPVGWSYTLRNGSHVLADRLDAADAEYIATMNPAVALAVADWLEVWAGSGWAECECNLADGDSHCEHTAALAVARAVLGETA